MAVRRMARGLWGFEDWLFNPGRLGACAVGAVAGYALGVLGLVLRGDWVVDVAGHPGASNYLCFWAAARLALAGHAGTAYNWTTVMAVQSATVPGARFTLPWLYPPVLLLTVTPLALLPYVASAFAWLAVTGAAYLAAAYATLSNRLAMLLAAGSPMVLLNIHETETGFAVAALIGLSLAFMERRPILAGVMLGLLTIKPQLGLLFPLVLIADGRWRTFWSATATVAALVVLTAALFGTDVWRGFLGAAPNAFHADTEQQLCRWADIQTWYSLARFAGLPANAAWTFHIAAAIGVSTSVCWVWRGPTSYNLKAAALATGALLVTPYVLMYDLVALGIPIVYLVKEGLERGFVRGERSLLLAMVMLPLYPWVADGGPPLMPAAITSLLVFILAKASGLGHARA